jgi:ABC-2 type transport system permease protein
VFERIYHMLVKEFIQVFRDPRMRALIFVMPVFQLMIFGYAANTDVRNVPTAVHDLDGTITSRDLIQRFERSGYFHIVAYVTSNEGGRRLMDRGEVRAILRVDRDFESDVLAGRSAPVQLILDGTDSLTTSVVMSYSAAIVEDYSRRLLAERTERAVGGGTRRGTVELQARAWFNENLESRDFYIPGVFGLLVGLITLMLTSMAVVREREIGTMEQIIVTPMRPVEFILGKTVPFALIGFADVLIVLLIGVFWFDVPVRGSVALLFVCMGLYVMTTLGVGLLISTVSRTQQQAMMSTFFFFMPAMLLSGFVFPIDNMPRVIQWVTYVNPLRYLLVIIRGIFLKGVGIDVLWPQMLALAALGVVTLAVASKRFRKTLS